MVYAEIKEYQVGPGLHTPRALGGPGLWCAESTWWDYAERKEHQVGLGWHTQRALSGLGLGFTESTGWAWAETKEHWVGLAGLLKQKPAIRALGLPCGVRATG